MRGLGSMPKTVNRVTTQQSRQRLQKATRTVRRISFLPDPLEVKATYIRNVALSAGLYSCEASSVDEAAFRVLTTAIVKLLQPRSYQTCHALVFALANLGEDLDPSIHVLFRRLLLLRRFYAKFPHSHADIKFLLSHYQKNRHVGTKHNGIDINAVKPAPSPRSSRQAQVAQSPVAERTSCSHIAANTLLYFCLGY